MIPGIFTTVTIRNGFLIKFYMAEPVKNVQIDPQTTEISSKKAKRLIEVIE